MTIKKTAVTTSFLLAMGLSLPGFADDKVEMVDGDSVTIECVTQADVDLMTEEDKAKLILPICDEMMEKKEETKTQ